MGGAPPGASTHSVSAHGDELIDVTRTCPKGPEGEDLGAVILRDIGNCAGILVDIQADIECASLLPG